MDEKKQMAARWQFRWPLMDVMIGGESSIDTHATYVGSMQDATRFLQAYGYDADHPSDARMMHATIVEALTFIERELMPREWRAGNRPPDEILNCDDPRWLMVWAAEHDEPHKARRAWACAVLRVAHSIAHIEGSYRHVDVGVAKEQIRARFEQFLQRDTSGKVTGFGQGDVVVPLHKFDWKNSKSRQSILLKLLHKRANVAETIYDLVGLRLVTHTQADTLLVVRMLTDLGIVSYPNCIPARARNTLIDLDTFRRELDELRGLMLSGKLTSAQFNRRMDGLALPAPAETADNPHSAVTYRSIQLTGRQLIRGRGSSLGWLTGLEAGGSQREKALGDLIAGIKEWRGMDQLLDARAFFPFEIQIMDVKSYSQNSQGAAAHGRYKSSQLRAARRRVLGEVLSLG
ncbi:MAG: hypothetical protein RIQ81_2189 [Pseudomonadota bacterium]|jgi:uncharacterized protein (TIGR04562 family)